MSDVEAAAQEFRENFERLRREVGRVIVGHDRVVEGVLAALVVG